LLFGVHAGKAITHKFDCNWLDLWAGNSAKKRQEAWRGAATFKPLDNSSHCAYPPRMTAALPFIDELRRLPADRLEEAADYIHTLIEERRLRRESMINATSGSLAGEEGDALEAALNECSTVDENAW
jgi:hypothetical protein